MAVRLACEREIWRGRCNLDSSKSSPNVSPFKDKRIEVEGRYNAPRTPLWIAEALLCNLRTEHWRLSFARKQQREPECALFRPALGPLRRKSRLQDERNVNTTENTSWDVRIARYLHLSYEERNCMSQTFFATR